jgi:DNA-binding response OmpR family regulator
MVKILYLEDEHYLGRIVKESLASRGYEMKLITDGANVMRNFQMFKPDICVLDIMVPNIDGYELAEMIKQEDPSMPIIFLSAKNQTEDVIQGFKSGGNDYIKKPFSMEELILRVENLLKLKGGSGKEENQIFVLGQFVFAYDKFELRHEESTVRLSHRENELLLMLCQHMNVRIDRRDILKKIWGDDSIYNSRNLDVYIRKLRVYFDKDSAVQLITLRGVGYHFSITS